MLRSFFAIVIAWAAVLPEASHGQGAWPRPGSDDIAGRLLVATPSLGDPRFVRTVIYMMSHGPRGSAGVVINLPRSNTSLRTFLGDMGIEGNGAKEDVIYQGGPLELGRPFVVHTSDYTIEGTNVGLAGLAVTVKRDVFHAIAAGKGPRRFLVALGRAGWEAGQLERELAAGVWVVVMADEGLVFEPDNDKKWDKAIERGKTPPLLALH